MGWGEPYAPLNVTVAPDRGFAGYVEPPVPRPLTMHERKLRAADDLAAAVTTWLSAPTSGNRQAIERALTRYREA